MVSSSVWSKSVQFHICLNVRHCLSNQLAASYHPLQSGVQHNHSALRQSTNVLLSFSRGGIFCLITGFASLTDIFI